MPSIGPPVKPSLGKFATNLLGDPKLFVGRRDNLIVGRVPL